MNSESGKLYDLGADFSLTNNPNGVWQYGFSNTESLAPGEFRLMKFANTTKPIGFWHPDATDGGYYPYIAHHSATSLLVTDGGGWALRPGEVALEASNSGQYSLIRFTAPESGTYRVTATFTGLHVGVSTTDAHVLHNADSLFDAQIEGYGGDTSLRTIVGKSPTATYNGVVQVKAGDIITFALGFGANRNHGCDTTGLIARIQREG